MPEQLTSVDVQAHAHQDGRSWAENRATGQELANLAAYLEASADRPTGLFDATDRDAYSPAEGFYFAIHPEDHGDCIGAADFWEDFFDTISEVDQEYVEAFAEGALAAAWPPSLASLGSRRARPGDAVESSSSRACYTRGGAEDPRGFRKG